jgi:hypothetical protein
MSRRLLTTALGLLCAAVLLAMPAGAAAQIAGLPSLSIPGPNLLPVEGFSGAQATPSPVGGVTPPPRNPFMAPNGRSNIHDDAYMTDTYSVGGPVGRNIQVSSAFFVRECGSITFDSAGRIVTVCVGIDRPVLAILDPQTLNVLAAMPLPLRNLGGGLNIFSDFSGGGYFYLDEQDRAVVPTTDKHVLVVAETAAPGFAVQRDFDLSSTVPQSDAIESVLPDWSGRIWFVSRNGLVGNIDRNTGAIRVLRLEGEGISNSFSVDETGGVFVVSDKALYRFDAGPQGEPTISWREVYPNSGVHKPGQSDAGSGTTPTLMGTRWVAIADNADPLDVVVYRRARISAAGREVCRQPVFAAGAGDTDQSLIGTDTSLIAENNYGYSGPLATEFGATTSPGLARVDLSIATQSVKAKKKKHKKRHKGKHKTKAAKKKRKKKKKKRRTIETIGCHLTWTSNERAPSVVPKLSLTNGLVYTYTKPPRSDGADSWYFTALDFRTGATVYKRLSGVGLGFNNNYAPVTIGPDGAAYVGVLGGVTRFADGP